MAGQAVAEEQVRHLEWLEIRSEITSNYLVPTVIEKTTYGERASDIYSRLLKDRIVLSNLNGHAIVIKR